jgi:hypothetical protein
MSKHRVLSFKPQLRPEWQGQDGQSETEQPDHSASLGDSITSSTPKRFSVHTERPEHVAQVRTRRTAAPDQPAADPSSIRSPAPTGRNESAITVGFNTEFFNTIRQFRTSELTRVADLQPRVPPKAVTATNSCVYRKLKLGRSDDKARQGSDLR